MKEATDKEPPAKEDRRTVAYVLLALLSVLLSVGTVLFVIKEVNEANHRWCQLIQASVPAKAPVKPADPASNPAQEKKYHNYVLVYNLGRGLGCL